MLVHGRLPWPLVFQVLGVLVAAWLLVRAYPVWILLFAAIIVAAAILPAARFGERYRIPRGVTVLVVFAAIAGVLFGLGRLLWPALAEQGRQFMEQLPELIENVKGWVGDLDLYIGQWGASLPRPQAGAVQDLLGPVLANTLRVTLGVIGGAVGVVAVLVIAAYIVIDAEQLGRGLRALLPHASRATAGALAEPVVSRIGGYVRGQLVASLFVGAVIAIGLTIMGVRYALLIGAVAAALNVVPFVGATIAGVLAVVSALNESMTLALGTVLLFWSANLVEAKLLVPQLVGRATGLHPLAVMLALLVGASLGGLLGALVAVPLLAALWEVTRVVWVEPQRD